MFPQVLLNRIERLLPPSATGRFCVAFSGGLDSTVLLHAMALIVREVPRFDLCAIHVDHQLQTMSAAWRAHCERVCTSLGVEFIAEQVTLTSFPEGVESAARAARYDVMRRRLRSRDTLLTAHHADDQIETVLLALVRGAGVNGLAAMPSIKPFGDGWHMRPLLETTRVEVESWARAAGLQWINDPSNDQPRFDRNYLRSEVLPALRQRWPAVARSVSRSAAHLGEARDLLAIHADDDLRRARFDRCLDMHVVRAMSPPRRRQLLRHWLADQGARMPSTRKLAALENDILTADADRTPQAGWDDVEVRRHGELLYCEKVSASPDADLSIEWSRAAAVTLPCDLGELQMSTCVTPGLSAAMLPAQLTIRFRRGGERLRLAGHEQRSHLKNLLQEAQILPWWRNRIPLVYAGNTLVAVADLWTASEFSAQVGEPSVKIGWTQRPDIYAVAPGHGDPSVNNDVG